MWLRAGFKVIRRCLSRSYCAAVLMTIIVMTSINPTSADEGKPQGSVVGNWLLMSMGNSAVSADTPWLTIGEDDSLAGHGGCNRFFGKAEIEDGALKLVVNGMSRMACDSRIMVLEARFLNALKRVTTWHYEADNHLVLSDGQGYELLRLTRQSAQAQN